MTVGTVYRSPIGAGVAAVLARPRRDHGRCDRGLAAADGAARAAAGTLRSRPGLRRGPDAARSAGAQHAAREHAVYSGHRPERARSAQPDHLRRAGVADGGRAGERAGGGDRRADRRGQRLLARLAGHAADALHRCDAGLSNAAAGDGAGGGAEAQPVDHHRGDRRSLLDWAGAGGARRRCCGCASRIS